MDTHLQLFQPILSLTQAVFLAGDVGLIRLELARALIGHEADDTVKVKTPGGVREYEIREIRFGS